jgi:hypothetical protein
LSLRKARSVNSPGRARRRRGSRGRRIAVALGGGLEAAREQQLHHDRPAVRLQLEHVLAGVGMRRRKVDRQAAVDRRALPVEEGHEGRVARLEARPQSAVASAGEALSGNADDADRAAPAGGGDGDDRLAGPGALIRVFLVAAKAGRARSRAAS